MTLCQCHLRPLCLSLGHPVAPRGARRRCTLGWWRRRPACGAASSGECAEPAGSPAFPDSTPASAAGHPLADGQPQAGVACRVAALPAGELAERSGRSSGFVQTRQIIGHGLKATDKRPTAMSARRARTVHSVAAHSSIGRAYCPIRWPC